MDHLSAVFSKCYQPSLQLSIYEMMMGYTLSNIIFTVHAQKVNTFWYQEAKTGYILDFAVYTGATDDKKTSLDQKVVLKFMEQYQGKGHCLFFNNFYTSPRLLLELLDQGTYCTGTVHTNRKRFPK